MERLTDCGNYPQITGKLRDDQIAQASTWGQVPDQDSSMAALHVIHVTSGIGTTVTYVNPLDPGDQSNGNWYDHGDRHDRLYPAGNKW